MSSMHSISGELSALLDQPHTAEVHAPEDSQFHVASTAAPLVQDPIAPLYVAALARRVDSGNRGVVALKCHVQAGQPSRISPKTIGKSEELPGVSGGNLVYAGYPYDPYVSDAAKH